MINWIWPLVDAEQITQITKTVRPNARQQLKLLQLIPEISVKEGLSQASLIKDYQISRGTVDHAVAQGWLKRDLVEQYRDPFAQSDLQTDQELNLNDEQASAFKKISDAVQNRRAKPILLEGVTGSGKTEVYLQSISQVLNQGRTAILMVPEISLTPLMVNRVRARFGDQVAVLHSALSDGEKFDEWRRIMRNEVKVVVGARSAVFAPLHNLGIIIMDEEHSETYKQTDAPRYHARDVAIYRAQNANCPVVLGSATPALESRARAERGFMTLSRFINALTNRLCQQ